MNLAQEQEKLISSLYFLTLGCRQFQTRALVYVPLHNCVEQATSDLTVATALIEVPFNYRQ